MLYSIPECAQRSRARIGRAAHGTLIDQLTSRVVKRAQNQMWRTRYLAASLSPNKDARRLTSAGGAGRDQNPAVGGSDVRYPVLMPYPPNPRLPLRFAAANKPSPRLVAVNAR